MKLSSSSGNRPTRANAAAHHISQWSHWASGLVVRTCDSSPFRHGVPESPDGTDTSRHRPPPPTIQVSWNDHEGTV